MNMEKMTNVQMFEALKELVKGDAREAEFTAFLDKRIEIASKKRTGETKVQKENKEVAGRIYDYMVETGAELTGADIMKEFGVASSQKVVGIMKGLVAEGKVTKDKNADKKTVYKVA